MSARRNCIQHTLQSNSQCCWHSPSLPHHYSTSSQGAEAHEVFLRVSLVRSLLLDKMSSGCFWWTGKIMERIIWAMVAYTLLIVSEWITIYSISIINSLSRHERAIQLKFIRWYVPYGYAAVTNPSFGLISAFRPFCAFHHYASNSEQHALCRYVISVRLAIVLSHLVKILQAKYFKERRKIVKTPQPEDGMALNDCNTSTQKDTPLHVLFCPLMQVTYLCLTLF